MEQKVIKLPLPNGTGYANLLFTKYQSNGSWICQMDEDFMETLEEELEKPEWAQ